MTSTALLRELSIADKQYFPKDNRISFYNFSNIWMWRKYVHYQILEVGDIPCVVWGLETAPAVMLPRIEDDAKLYDTLCELKRPLGSQLTVRPLDGAMKERMRKLFPDALFNDERSMHDYIYNATDLIELSGKKYHGKRNHINAFLETYPDYRYVRVTEENLDLLRSTAEVLYKKDDRLPDEYIAIGELIDHFGELGLKAGIIFVGDNPIAYSIGEKMCDDTALIHIEKGDRDYRGAYPMINQLFASDFADCTYINREEDMGLEGLRKAKTSYHPAFMGEYCSAKV